MSNRYPTPAFRRTALAPGILAAIVLLAGLALLHSSAFIWIRYGVSILALIVVVFAWQSRQWWWLILLVPIAIVWNPVWPITPAPDQLWLGLQYIATIVFVTCGILIKVPNKDDRNARNGKAASRR
ncbi:MAG: hypothetical protein JWR53_1343 [Glaciihabitans sp.]|nr:hypothetical protein [Glaciihabitans sp.]MDQ1555168.1 hypothetical protein [Actinomycetota bacterium]